MNTKNIENRKELDLYDKKILYELDINARASASFISKKIKLSKETVNFRIKRLIKKGYIKYFYTIINASKLGYQYYKVFFKFHKLTSKIENDIISYIQKQKNCINLRVMEGPYDLCFITMHKNFNNLKGFLHKFNNLFGAYILKKSINTLVNTYKLNQKIFYSEKTDKKCFYHGEIEDYKLDDIDLKIIRLLSTKARMKSTDIAKNIRKDPELIRYHLKKLEDNKVILGYFSSLNFDILNRTPVQIDISLKDPEYIPHIVEFFDNTNTCIFVYELLGRYDLSVEIYIKDNKHLKSILTEFKEKFIEHYIFYDVSRIYQNFVINWSPFDAYETQSL